MWRWSCYQCVMASNELALSVWKICGVVQPGADEVGRMRLRTITMGCPHAQSQVGRVGAASTRLGAACITCTKASVRRALCCSTPKSRTRCKPLGKTCCSNSHKKSSDGGVRMAGQSPHNQGICPYLSRSSASELPVRRAASSSGLVQ